MALPKGFESSQYAATSGRVCFEVGSAALVESALFGPHDVQLLPPNSSQPLVEIASVLYAVPSSVTVKGSVGVATLSRPLSDVNPLMSSGLLSIWAARVTRPVRPTSTDQPSSDRLSSRIFPSQVRGRTGGAEAPPAPW